MTKTHLNRIFSQAYILGGSPCSGKSTLAEMLAAQGNFYYYKADDHDPEHMRQSTPEQQPVMSRYASLSWDTIWSQSPERLLADALAYYHERFPLILNDLSLLSEDRPILLEGVAFLPDLLHHYPVNPKHVIFMVPTFEFQLHHYRQRPWIQSILKECHDPHQAFANWMKRDRLFGLEMIRQAHECGFPVILVDGSVNISTQLERIRAQFDLGC